MVETAIINKKHYTLWDINLLRHDNAVKKFNLSLCENGEDTPKAARLFMDALQTWLRNCVSAELADVEDLHSFKALRDYAETASIAKKQKTGQARRR